MFKVENVSYKYYLGEKPTLQDISFEVKEGEVVGIAGESGSGKSTLEMMMAGYIPHFIRLGDYKGQILFDGNNVARNEDFYSIMRRIGMVFQDPSTQSFGMKVEDAITFGMENIGMRREEMQERLNMVMKKMKIEHLNGRSTTSLSGGEAQATAIATVLAINKAIIFWDEAISALDPWGQQRVKDAIKELSGEGKTMVIIDSDVRWLAKNVDRLLILNEGSLKYDGDPEKVFIDQELATFTGLGEQRNGEFREARREDPTVDVKGVSFAYNGHSALEDINLKIRRGSCTALMGPNGSGKSTLAKIMAGLLKPQNGGVAIDGKEISKLSSTEAAKAVGYLFQRPTDMFVKPRVRDEFEYTAKQLGVAPAVRLEDFNIQDGLEVTPWSLPSGQQQRLATAGVLASNPNIVILDEPTQGQTRRDREIMVETIKQRQRQGQTVVIISHDTDFVRRAAEEVHFFESGQLKYSGTTKELFEKLNLN